MKRKLFMLGILILVLTVNTGCWNRKELNELAIEVAMGFDKSGDKYRITSQVVDPGEVAAKDGGTGRTPVITYQATADTPFEARRKMTTMSPRKIYSAHIRMVVIGEELARDGIENFLDFLSRDHEHRADFFIVVAKGTSAENVLKILTPQEKIPANELFDSLKTSERAWAPTSGVTLHDLLSDLVSTGKHPVLTGLKVKGSQEIGQSKENVEKIDNPTRLQYIGLGVFKKDKLVGWLNETESKGYNYIMDNVKNTVGVIRCPKGGKAVLEVIRSKAAMKGKVKNGKPEADVEIRIEANVGEVECKNLDLTQTNTIYEMEARAEQKVKEFAEKTIKKAQKKYKADIFGFGEAIRRTDPKFWKTVEKNWDQEFTDLPVNVKVDVKIRRTGTVSQSFLKGLEE
ncbi:Ger(x)C family spore germination protein [Paenibacillus sp. Soil522]|uniref:Ger(x)C family spore germination protein n=1 Tax=Paenibacillus sp. Soil522 TaxID=1736388 RepID=UPI000701FD44|nr:Ger(x)C family spore germination protein [Paenibacillus sp. Soil522]KRE54454.1 spore gernimation protein GerC [Paenibacillus sp. Soil522]